MKLRGLKRVCNDFRRHPWLHFISVTTITVALLLLGAFLVFFRNVERVAEKTNPRVTGTIYLKEALSADQVRELRDKVFALETVRQVTFKDKDSVVGEIQTFLGESATKAMPGSEIFPDVLEVELEAGTSAATVAQTQKVILAMAGVSDADFSDGWLIQYKKIRRFGKFIGIFLLLTLVIGCGFIIANFMGLRHQSRQEEIQIARMMGAHRGFILAPFLWEGLIEGILGACAAFGVLWVTTLFLSHFVTVEWGSLTGIKQLSFLSPSQLAAMMGVGIAMALVGSILVFFRFREAHHS